MISAKSDRGREEVRQLFDSDNEARAVTAPMELGMEDVNVLL